MAKRVTDITELLEGASKITQPAALLEALLDAYRKRPLPALAGLIELAGKRAAVEHPMKGSLNDQHATWKTIAAGKGATDVEWLIANAITGRAEYSIERIELLKDWPIDPRLSSGLLALADGKKMTSRQSRGCWRQMSKEGILQELKRRRFYEKPSVKKKRKTREARKRLRREMKRRVTPQSDRPAR